MVASGLAAKRAYAKNNSLLVVSACNLWTDQRVILAVVRKRRLCKCSCRGWESLQSVFLLLRWCVECLQQGRHPSQRHDGRPWNVEVDAERAEVAGNELPFRGAILQLRADWAEVAHTMAVPAWTSHAQHMPWDLKPPRLYEEACGRCEVQLEGLNNAQQAFLQESLQHDLRKDGVRGMVLSQNVRALGLRMNDRLEPSPSMPAVSTFFGADPPGRVVFWRRSSETSTLRRNPLLSASLGTDLQTMVALDMMHTLCLGIFQDVVSHCMWALLEDLPVEGARGRNAANRHHLNMNYLRTEYQQWLRQVRVQQPGLTMTPVGDFALELLGRQDAPSLRCKAHESLTLLRWLAVAVPRWAGTIRQGAGWADATQALVRMWNLITDAPMVIPDDTQENRRLAWEGVDANKNLNMIKTEKRQREQQRHPKTTRTKRAQGECACPVKPDCSLLRDRQRRYREKQLQAKPQKNKFSKMKPNPLNTLAHTSGKGAVYNCQNDCKKYQFLKSTPETNFTETLAPPKIVRQGSRG